MTNDIVTRLKNAAVSCPWRAGQPVQLLADVAEYVEHLEGKIQRVYAVTLMASSMGQSLFSHDILEALKE